MVIDLQETVKKNSGNVWSYNTWPTTWTQIAGLWQWGVNQAMKTAKNIMNRKNQNQNKAKQDRLNNAKIEETIWWNNYYLPWNNWEQWQLNALNGTWHVAWIPTGPSMELIEPTQAPEPEAAVTPVTNTPTNKKATTAPMQQPVQQEIPEEQKTSEDYWILPEQQEQEPEVVEEIPQQEFGAQLSEWWYVYGRELGTDSNGNDFQFWEYTNADPNSPEAKSFASRRNNYNALQSMNSYDVATLIAWWVNPYWDQAMYDLQQFNPAKYQQIQDYLKEIRAEDNIYAISHGETNAWSTFVQTTEEWIKSSKDSWIDQNSTARTKDQVNTMLSTKMDSNITAWSAKQQMMMYKDQIVDLQYELEDLPNQARKAFKWDMPDYMYKARMSNRQQEIQVQMDKLESKYNAMADIYKTEMSQMQRQAEMELKYRQLELQQNNANFDMWYKSAQLEQNQVQRAKDAQWNMKAYKIVNWQVIQVDDWTAYQWYTTTVSWLVSQANQMASVKATWWQCEQFTDNMAQKAAWVRMVWTSAWWETTAAEKAWYATQFGTFSDYIPEVGDVAVFTNNWSNWVSPERWHTMYVTWYDPATWLVSMVWSNNGWDEKVYSMQYSLWDFYNKWWQWFWNPYKYAQWTAQVQSSTWSSTSWNPMETTIDNLIDSWKLNATQTTNISKFGYAYENLWRSKQNGELDSLLQQGAAATFFQELATSLANTQSWQSVWSQTENAAKVTLDQFIKQVEIAAAQKMGDGSSAYMWLMAIVWVIESKLRKESGAAINGAERAMDFLQYLPQAWDTKYSKTRKLENLETFLKYWGKEWGITWKQYIPIFTSSSNWKRSID